MGFYGCVGNEQLRAELTEAQRERAVLRDAYDAQQLRVKELESRLVQLEDQRSWQSSSPSEKASRRADEASRVFARPREPIPHAATGLQGRPMIADSSDASQGEESWGEQRLRSLPVVRVKRPRPIEREVERKKRGREESASGERPHETKPRSSRGREGQAERLTAQPSTPSLTSETLSSYQDPDRAPRRAPSPPPQPIKDEVKSASPATIEAGGHPPSELPEHRRSQHAQDQVESTPQTDLGAGTQPEMPSEGRLLLAEASALKSQGHLDRASVLVRRIITESPTDQAVPQALYLMGRIQIERGDIQGGKGTLMRLSRLYPNTNAADQARAFLQERSR